MGFILRAIAQYSLLISLSWLAPILLVLWYLFFMKILHKDVNKEIDINKEVHMIGLIYILTSGLIIFVAGFTAEIFSIALSRPNPELAISSLDYMYWASATFTTLGYGEFVPLRDNGKIFSMTLSILGTLHMVLFVAAILERSKSR